MFCVCLMNTLEKAYFPLKAIFHGIIFNLDNLKDDYWLSKISGKTKTNNVSMINSEFL